MPVFPNDEEKSSDEEDMPILRDTTSDESSFTENDSTEDLFQQFAAVHLNRHAAPPPRLNNNNDDDEEDDVPGLIDHYNSYSSDGDDDSSDDDDSMPSLNHGSSNDDSSDGSLPDLHDGTDSSSSGDDDSELTFPPQRATSNNNGNSAPSLKERPPEARIELKPPLLKHKKLFVVKCRWCDGNLTEQCREHFKKIVKDEIYGNALVCPGCRQSYEISKEIHAECKFCKLPPPHLGPIPGSTNTFICQDCAIMRGITYKKKKSFQSYSLHKGHAFGTPVHLVRMNVKGGGFEEGTDGNRAIVVGWMHPFHLVWVEGTAATDTSCVPIQCLRVVQFNPVTFEEEPVLLPTKEFSDELNNYKLTSKSEFKNLVKYVLMNTSSIFPKSLCVEPSKRNDNNKPLDELYNEMRALFATSSNLQTNYLTVTRVMDAWIKMLDLVVGTTISPKMQPKKANVRLFDSVVFMITASKIATNFLVDFLVRTPFIGPRGSAMEEFEQGHDFTKVDTLTPDQSHKCYIATMLLGPLRFLYVVSQLQQYSVFWKCLGSHPRASILIERLLRIVSREAIGEPDGVLLGKYSRPPLTKMLTTMLESPLSLSIAETALAIPPFRQGKTPYDEYYGDLPPLEGDDSDLTSPASPTSPAPSPNSRAYSPQRRRAYSPTSPAYSPTNQGPAYSPTSQAYSRLRNSRNRR